MELSNKEKRTIEYQFDSFCKKILREESRSIKRKMQREKNLTSYAIANPNQEDLFVYEKYPSDLHQFNVDQYQFGIENEKLAKALLSLPDNKRNIILLKYFWDMTDDEIANYLKQVRTTVMRQRTRTCTIVKEVDTNYKENVPSTAA